MIPYSQSIIKYFSGGITPFDRPQEHLCRHAMPLNRKKNAGGASYLLINDLAHCRSKAHNIAVAPGLAGGRLAAVEALVAAGKQSADVAAG